RVYLHREYRQPAREHEATPPPLLRPLVPVRMLLGAVGGGTVLLFAKCLIAATTTPLSGSALKALLAALLRQGSLACNLLGIDSASGDTRHVHLSSISA